MLSQFFFSYYNTGEFKRFTCTYKQGSLVTNGLYDLFHGRWVWMPQIFFSLSFFFFFARYENAAAMCVCVCILYIKLWLEKSVNNRKSSIDKNVLTWVTWVTHVWQSGFWVVCSFVSSVDVVISLYSDVVFNRNADYTVIVWWGSTVG